MFESHGLIARMKQVQPFHIGVVSTFYPNSIEPVRATFVRNLVTAIRRSGVDVSVVAPVPYAPQFLRSEKYRRMRRVPAREKYSGEEITHPRYVVVPKLGGLSGITYFMGCRTAVADEFQRYGTAVLHAHCAYPDAVGVGMVARQLNIPYVVTVHGSDINVVARSPLVRAQIRWALRNASGLIGVSRELCEKMVALVPSREKHISHIPCAGVDSSVFSVHESAVQKKSLNISQVTKLVLFAGRLVPVKSVDTLIRAWGQICTNHEESNSYCLVIVGDGPERTALEKLTSEVGVRDKVRFIGEVSQEDLAHWLSACSVFCLPSKSEGTPNTIVEALASGRPVVASSVGGIPELINSEYVGILVEPGNVNQLARGLQAALRRQWNPRLIAQTVKHLTWETLAIRNVEAIRNALKRFGKNAS